jgi:indole-3-glycerol phosphate synthase
MTILDDIAKYKRDEVAAAMARTPYPEVARLAANAPPVRPFAASLSYKIATTGTALIAEIKRASPSKGLIRADFDPPQLARAYEDGGAACLSILTDGPSFQGSADYLVTARASCTLPVLRKDFMLSPYQIAEARAMGADCILIIMAMVDDPTAAMLSAEARRWNMDVLIETHDAYEMRRALRIDGRMIGINNRNLHTFDVKLETTEMLAPMIPERRMAVAESGIATPADIARLKKSGVKTFLVGESLMRQADVSAATRALMAS